MAQLPAGGVAGQADRDEQGAAVEQRGDPEPCAELADAGEADGEDRDGDQGAQGVGASGPDGGGTQQGADEGGQQVVDADAGIADLLLGGELAARR
ncbi:hypothetical protein J7E86_06830 [Streptomyces sp. ISL-11]|nr:hypothetical protein [Streptomyces sp. ISL-11]